jgi:hypothetical protein
MSGHFSMAAVFPYLQPFFLGGTYLKGGTAYRRKNHHPKPLTEMKPAFNLLNSETLIGLQRLAARKRNTSSLSRLACGPGKAKTINLRAIGAWALHPRPGFPINPGQLIR